MPRYEGGSICNEIALITPSTHGLELYTILREINLAISDKAGCILNLLTKWKII